MKVTPWPMKTWSSIVTPSQTKVASKSCSAGRSSRASDLDERPDLRFVTNSQPAG